jgi:hypothetical protein
MMESIMMMMMMIMMLMMMLIMMIIMMMAMVLPVMIGQHDDDGGDGDAWTARFTSTIDSIGSQCTPRARLAKLASELDLFSEISMDTHAPNGVTG